MNRRQQYKSDAFARAQQVLDSHADVFGAVNQSPARQQLDASVRALATTAVEQHTRSRETIGEQNHQASLERDLEGAHMRPMVKFARADLRGVPNFKALTPVISGLRGAKLVNVAKALAEAAEPYAERFTAAKFPADFLTQLQQSADAVLASISVRRGKHLQRVGATAHVKEALSSGRSALASLDAVVSRTIRGDARLMEEWRVAKRVVSKPGLVRIASNAVQAAEPVAPPIAEAA